MGISGVKFDPGVDCIKDTIKKAKGRVNKIAEAHGVGRSTIYNYFRDHPELKEVLDATRVEFVEELLDMSEGTLEYALQNKDTDINSALRAAFFTLNNLGGKLGYGNANYLGDKEVKIVVSHYAAPAIEEFRVS